MMPSVAHDQDLANRIRELIAGEPDVSERNMFGGLVFLVGGHMSVAAGAQAAWSFGSTRRTSMASVRRGRERLHYLNAAPINEIAELDQPLDDTTMEKPSFVLRA